MAYKLLMSLLALPSLVTALDHAGEIPLAAAVHNPRCIDRLEQLCTTSSNNRSKEGSPQTEAREGVPLLITSVPNMASSAASPADVSMATTSSSSMSVSSVSSSSEGSSAVLVPAGSSWASIRLMPYTSPLGDIEGASAFLQLPQLSPTPSHDSSTTPTLPEPAQVGQMDPADMDTVPSPTNSHRDQMFDSLVKNLDEVMTGDQEEGEGLGEVSGSFVQEKDVEAMEELMDGNGINGETHESHLAELAPKLHTTGYESGTVRKSVGGLSPSNRRVAGEKSKKTVTFMPEPICISDALSGDVVKSKSSNKSLLFHPSSVDNAPVLDAAQSREEANSAVKLLFSDWSSIMMIVLGFDPSTLASLPSFASPPPHVCSVHSLDNFSTDLLLNCSQLMISYFVDSIITRLNSALQSCLDSSLVTRDLDYSDPDVISRYLSLGEEGVALLVGRRFLGSMVRLLALEHSRVKNRFLEMQQARLAAASQAGRCGW